MKTFSHILVATDGSALSARAVKAAIRMSAATGARLSAIHVIPHYMPPVFLEGAFPAVPPLYSTMDYKRATHAYSKRLLAKVEAAARAAKVRCNSVSVTGEAPWSAIVAAARKRRCDLVVMASHGWRGIDALLLGSETRKVLTHSKTPVLVVR